MGRLDQRTVEVLELPPARREWRVEPFLGKPHQPPLHYWVDAEERRIPLHLTPSTRSITSWTGDAARV